MATLWPIARRLRVSSLVTSWQLSAQSRPYSVESSPSQSSSSFTKSTPSSSSLPKPRLDYRKIASDPESHNENARLRKSPMPPDAPARIAELYSQSLQLGRTLDGARAEQRNVGEAIRAGMEKKKGSDKALWLQRAKKLKGKIIEQETAISAVEAELLNLALVVPNDTHPSTPTGPEENAIEVDRFGPPPMPSDPRRDHLSICLAFDWVDPSASSISSGSSWAYLKGVAALLELALVNYAVSVAVRRGWTPVATPDVVKEDVMARCGFVPRDQAGQTYHVGTSSTSTDTLTPLEGASGSNNLVLAATAEIPLAALSADRIFSPSALPIKYVGIGKAFRAEAGARGADTRGLYRLHQFTKVELFTVTDPEGSEGMMKEMRDVQKEVFEGLGLSVRVLNMPSEELGASAYRKYDMEAWMPGRGKWGEISSTSNCTDFQARRLHIRYRPRADPTGSATANPTAFAHTLNGTCAAIPRLLIALMENGVELDGDGRVVGLSLPAALRQFWIGPANIGTESCPIVWHDA